MTNPNTSAGVTDLVVAAAEAVAAPETQIVPATAPRGVPYIATRAEAVIGGAIALEMLAELHEGVDAAVIAAFADPGLGGARELFPIPVIGLAESGMLTACMLGGALFNCDCRRGALTLVSSKRCEEWACEARRRHSCPRRIGTYALVGTGGGGRDGRRDW